MLQQLINSTLIREVNFLNLVNFIFLKGNSSVKIIWKFHASIKGIKWKNWMLNLKLCIPP